MGAASFAQRITTRLNEKIEESGYTADEVAEKANLSPSTLTRKLAGNSAFSIAELAMICLALEIPISGLLATDTEEVR